MQDTTSKAEQTTVTTTRKAILLSVRWGACKPHQYKSPSPIAGAYLALLYAVQSHAAQLMAQRVKLLQRLLEHRAQQEQLLVEHGLGVRQLAAVDC